VQPPRRSVNGRAQTPVAILLVNERECCVPQVFDPTVDVGGICPGNQACVHRTSFLLSTPFWSSLVVWVVTSPRSCAHRDGGKARVPRTTDLGVRRLMPSQGGPSWPLHLRTGETPRSARGCSVGLRPARRCLAAAVLRPAVCARHSPNTVSTSPGRTVVNSVNCMNPMTTSLRLIP
jgi:hypothetical protein